MSGHAGLRGYMLQTLICVLDSLDDDSWTGLNLEPGHDSEKADIIWRFPDKTRATQVKHSANQITKSMVEKWAQELETEVTATEHELRLAGPSSGSVAAGLTIGGVHVKAPTAINISVLMDQAAHQIDRFFERNGISKVPAFAREIVVGALVTRLSEYSTVGHFVKRSEFVSLLTRWVSVLYPTALSEAAEQMHAKYEEKLERLRHALQQEDRITAARYKLKHDACLEALDIVDQAMASATNVQVGKKLNPFELGEIARSCHNKLVVACDDPEVVRIFRLAVGIDGSPRGDIVVDLRNAVRRELGFGDESVDSDREKAFIGTAGYDMSLPEDQEKRIADLRANWRDEQSAETHWGGTSE